MQNMISWNDQGGQNGCDDFVGKRQLITFSRFFKDLSDYVYEPEKTLFLTNL